MTEFPYGMVAFRYRYCTPRFELLSGSYEYIVNNTDLCRGYMVYVRSPKNMNENMYWLYQGFNPQAVFWKYLRFSAYKMRGKL